MAEEMNDPVAHAKSYPFPVPGRSYTFCDGRVTDMPDEGFDSTGRRPVLAAGSNQSHEQLARKFYRISGNVEIPVQKGRLHDFDSVYAAHLAGYGSVPSTFYPSPGTVVTTYLLWLDDAQLNRMHETERNYTYDHLNEIRVEIDGLGELLREAYAYTAKIGCVNHAGTPIALSEISACERAFSSMSQLEVLEHIRDRIAPNEDLDTFILSQIEDEGVRRARSAILSEDAIVGNYPRTVIREL
tara:strand:- start:23329 stop:24054 length:726 start_codon:yes stop_codon:yes gene_type:complete